MDEIYPLMVRTAARTADLVLAIDDEQFGRPTPCAKFDVKALIVHLEWVAATFESLASKGPFAEQEPYAGDFPQRALRTLAAWSVPEAWEGVSPGMGMPMTSLSRMYLIDMVVHGWDLARSTGQDYTPDSEAVEALFGFAQQMAPTGRKMGAFGDEVTVAADAPTFDRLLGIIGRDPAWTP